MRYFQWGFLGVVALAMLGCATTEPQSSSGGLAIRPSGVGPLEIGMTVKEARAALGKNYQLVAPRTQPILICDAAYAVRDSSGQLVAEFTMQDWSQPLAVGNRIAEITARSPLAKTGEGVHPGMSLAKAGAIYGPATLSQEMEATGVENLRFRNQPSYLNFVVTVLVSNLAGIYANEKPASGTRVTSDYRRDARIAGITVGH